jgi:hypothetical protein
MLASGLVFVAGGSFFLVPACSARLDYARLQEEGVVVQGTVMGKRTTKNGHSVDYSFFTSDKRWIQGSARRGGEQMMKLEVGGPVTVAYLPSRPEINRVLPPGFTDMDFGLAIVGIGLVLLVMAAFRWPRRVFAR